MTPEDPPPESLMPKHINYQELRGITLSNLDAAIDRFPPLPVPNLTLEELAKLPERTYQLHKRPSINLLRELLHFKGGTAEVGLLLLNNRWLITLGSGMEVMYPSSMKSIDRDHVFQLEMHTHPGKEDSVTQPSDQDANNMSGTIDGTRYLITKYGFCEYRKPHFLPGGVRDESKIGTAWRHWIVDELKLNEDEYEKKGPSQLKQEFFEKFFGLRTIPWENESEIEEIIDSKEKLIPNPIIERIASRGLLQRVRDKIKRLIT